MFFERILKHFYKNMFTRVSFLKIFGKTAAHYLKQTIGTFRSLVLANVLLSQYLNTFWRNLKASHLCFTKQSIENLYDCENERNITQCLAPDVEALWHRQPVCIIRFISLFKCNVLFKYREFHFFLGRHLYFYFV